MSTPKNPRSRAFVDSVVIAGFLVMLLAPTFDLLARDDEARGPAPEFRKAAPRPKLEADMVSIAKFPSRYEAFFSDTFGLRDRLLRLNSLEKYYLLGISPTNQHVVGRDGWLFYAGDGSRDAFRGARPLSPQDLRNWQAELEGRARALAAIDCKYLFALVPNKETVYPERMPSAVSRIGPTRMDQFVEWMQAHSQVDVLDMRPAFLADKLSDSGPMDPLYTPHGTHWTSRGVYTAYRAVVSHLAPSFPDVKPLDFDAFEVLELPFGADSLAGNLYLNGILLQPGDMLARRGGGRFTPVEGRFPKGFQRTQAPGPNLLPHALLFHDSFGPFIACTIAESFQTLDMCAGLFDARHVVPGETKIVIEMFVERYLMNHAPDPRAEQVLLAEDPRFAFMPHELATLESKPGAVFHASGVEIEHPAAGGVRFQRRGVETGLVIGPMSLPAEGPVLVRLDVESEVPLTLAMMWRSTDGGTFNRQDCRVLEIGPQRGVHTLELPCVSRTVELLLRPRLVDVPITLHAFSVRSSEAP